MFLTNQPFQRGWETQKNRPLIKVTSFLLFNLTIGLALLQNLKPCAPLG